MLKPPTLLSHRNAASTAAEPQRKRHQARAVGLAQILRCLLLSKKPKCYLTTGETTVTPNNLHPTSVGSAFRFFFFFF